MQQVLKGHWVVQELKDLQAHQVVWVLLVTQVHLGQLERQDLLGQMVHWGQQVPLASLGLLDRLVQLALKELKDQMVQLVQQVQVVR